MSSEVRRPSRLAHIHVFTLMAVALTILVACATGQPEIASTSANAKGPDSDPSPGAKKTTAERWIERNLDRP